MIKFGDGVLFDRLEFYSDEPKVYANAKQRFTVLMEWLSVHDMLSDEGQTEAKDIIESSVPDEFSLSDRILTEEGTAFLKAHYEKWMFSEGTSDPITTRMLDSAIKEQR